MSPQILSVSEKTRYQLTTIRAALDHHLLSPPFTKPFCIITDSQFNNASTSLSHQSEKITSRIPFRVGHIKPRSCNFGSLFFCMSLWCITGLIRELKQTACSDWLIQRLLIALGCTLLTYSITKAKRALCDVAQQKDFCCSNVYCELLVLIFCLPIDSNE